MSLNPLLGGIVMVGASLLCTPALASEITDAAFEGDTERVRALLKDDPALAQVREENGWSPLHAAADAGHTEVVQLLVEKGAGLEQRTKTGWTPLMVAACNGRSGATAYLLSKGARTEAADDRFGRTALHWAAIQGNLDVVKLLLGKGARVNTKDKAKATALGYAKTYGRVEIGTLLTRSGGKS